MKCSIVIATLNRPESLRLVLDCLGRQDEKSFEVIIADAGDAAVTRALVDAGHYPFAVTVLPFAEKSSARQRNQGASIARGEILAFLDDDIEFGADLLRATLDAFVDPTVGAVSPRIINSDRPAPGRLTRWYYGVQAGYAHRDYGAKLFGAGINCFPVFAQETAERIPADWLPSTCLFVRAAVFARHRFPNFTGYSFAEDVHLTARIAREAKLYFLRTPELVHNSAPSEFKANAAALTAGKLENMARVAREAQGLDGWSLVWRWHLHRLFLGIILLLKRPKNYRAELSGVWLARFPASSPSA
jgi:glycosyltransferase involved in cell wall biosynthesis